MKFITQNTWKNEGDYAARLAGLADVLTRARPDVALLQECFCCAETSDDTAGALAAHLGFGLCRAYGRRKRRWHAEEWRESSSGLAILSRYPMSDCQQVPLPSSDRGGERMALIARVNAPDGPWWVACAHFSHVREEIDLRQEQIETTLRALAAAAGREPAVLGADCNCEPDSAEILSAQRTTGIAIRNALPELGVTGPTHPWPLNASRPGRQLDQIWFLNTLDAPILAGGILPASSDHAAVWVEVMRAP